MTKKKKTRKEMKVRQEGKAHSLSLSVDELHLSHLLIFHDHIFHDAFCLDLTRGLAIEERSCPFCCQQTLYTGCVVKKEKTEEIDDNAYKIDLFSRELARRGGAREISYEGKDNLVSQGVKHISWFMIQLLLFNSPVQKVLCDVMRNTIVVTWDAFVVEDEDIKPILMAIQRNVTSLSKEERLKTLIDDNIDNNNPLS